MVRIASCRDSLEDRPDLFAVEAFSSALPPSWIAEAIRACGRDALRIRLLPPQLVASLVILMGLYRRDSYVNLLGRVREATHDRGLWRGDVPSTSALSRARDRVGIEPLRRLFERSAHTWLRQTQPRLFHGHRALALDGSTGRTPDTPENMAFFDRPGAIQGHASHPQFRTVILFDISTRLARAASFGGYRDSEYALAGHVLHEIDPGSLVVMDRGFNAFGLLQDILDRGAQFLLRVRSTTRFKVLQNFGPGDDLVRVRADRKRRRERPELPPGWVVRRIRYQLHESQEEYVLVTSLLDPRAIPAARFADLYKERWEAEIGFDEIKCHLLGITASSRPTAVRSMLPKRVLQELWGILIAYNLVRILMAMAAPRATADTAPLPPKRLSFTYCLSRIGDAVPDMMRAPTHRLVDRFEQLLWALARVVVPPRPGRSYPRAVKRKASNYPVKRSRLAGAPP